MFLYDTGLKVPWLRAANANGAMTWDDANTWASGLSSSATAGGTTGWRLPTMADTGNPGCDHAYGGGDCGFNVQTTSSTVFSEMASLWYDTLGNKAFVTTAGGSQLGGLTKSGDFQNLRPRIYWYGLEHAPRPSSNAWYLFAGGGAQEFNDFLRPDSPCAMAVRVGDVPVSPIPEPETYALMLAGLAAVGAAARRRKSK